MSDDQPAAPPGGEHGGGPEPAAPVAERSSRLTTTIPRPTLRRASDAGRSRLARRRDEEDDRISTRRVAWLFGLGAVVVAGAIAAALFVLPVRTWFGQNDQIRALEHELGEMQSVNRELAGEVDRLQTADGIREAAREELGQVQAGDRRLTVVEPPALPRNMPAGWPYVHVDQILTLRAAGAVGGADGAADPSEDPGEDPGSGGFQPIAPAPPASVSVSTPATTGSG